MWLVLKYQKTQLTAASGFPEPRFLFVLAFLRDQSRRLDGRRSSGQA
jgi:hypothetical protein